MPIQRTLNRLTLPEGWKVCDLDDALAGAGEEPPWVIQGLLPAGTATQVSAHPHSMKSLAWLAAAIEAPALGTVWRHFDASPVKRTIFIESEDPKWVVESRIRGIAAGLGLQSREDVPGFHYVRTGPFDFVKSARTLENLFKEHSPDFAVLSTLQSLLSGRDWNEQKQMQEVNAMIVRLSSLCPLVVITHSPWDKRAKRAAGTVTQAANFATTMHFEKISARGDTLVHVSLDSKMGADEADFSLRLETEGDGANREVRRIVYAGAGCPRGEGKSAVLAAIEDEPEAPSREIAERLGVSPRYVQKLRKGEIDTAPVRAVRKRLSPTRSRSHGSRRHRKRAHANLRHK